MHIRKLAVFAASAALAIGGLAFVTGCDSDKDNSRRSDTGAYNDGDVTTAGNRTGPGDPDNTNPNGTYGTGNSGSIDSSNTANTGGTGTSTGGTGR